VVRVKKIRKKFFIEKWINISDHKKSNGQTCPRHSVCTGLGAHRRELAKG